MGHVELPWEAPGWLEQATEWIHDQLAAAGRHRTGPVEIIHQRPWSTFARIATDKSTVYFKAPAPADRYEATLTEALARWPPDCSVRRWRLTPMVVGCCRRIQALLCAVWKEKIMDYVNLGNSGLEVSQLCLGAWMFGTELKDGVEVIDQPTAHEILDAAWSHGVNFFDTANNYGQGRSERYIGEWLADKDRENFVIASKVYNTTRGRQPSGLSRKIIMAEIEGTLERLGTDYLDIYYIHGWHSTSPLKETLSAMNDLVRGGRVHYIGVSNFSSAQLVKSTWMTEKHGWAPITVIQPRYNAADHIPYTVDPVEQPLPDLFDVCRELEIAVCPYAPLAGGFLAGKYERQTDGKIIFPGGSRADLTDRYGPFPERWWRVLDAVRDVASEVGASPAQVALRWSMIVDGITSIPIFGGRSLEQLKANVAALDVSLTSDQHEQIAHAGLYQGSNSPYIYTD
jgi:aryl-alcohol dehydrogenase-like predicted oxidoreductase